MKRNGLFLGAAVAGVLITTLLMNVEAADVSPERPSFVADADWVQVSDSLGIVVTSSERGGRPAPGYMSAVPSVDGYFMVKKNGSWARLDVELRPQLLSLR